MLDTPQTDDRAQHNDFIKFSVHVNQSKEGGAAAAAVVLSGKPLGTDDTSGHVCTMLSSHSRSTGLPDRKLTRNSVRVQQ